MTEEIKEMGRWRKEVCEIVSEMLDNPDEHGIYPTTRCYERLDSLIDDQEKFWEGVIEDAAKRAGVDTRGLVGNAILHTMVEKIEKLEADWEKVKRILVGEN